MKDLLGVKYIKNQKRALDDLQKIKGLEHHHLYFATIGEMYFELDEKENTRTYFEKVICLSQSQSEIHLLREKISLC